MRADAARNRAAIVAAARELIVVGGGDAGMDEIAARAGVAVGTLYRHFPTKGELVAAIMAELGTAIGTLLDAAVSRVDAGVATAHEEIAALLRRVVIDMADDRVLRDAAGALPPEVERRAREVLSRLVAAARAEGALQPDVTVDDLTLLLATAPGDGTPETRRARWVTLVLRALSVP